MSKLNFMKTFLLTVEKGNMALVAKHLGISKAAVSKQIIELEKNLNTQLLRRTTRALILTEAGQLYYESLRKVFSAIGEAESSISQIHSNPTGRLRIASHRYIGEKYIVNHLHEFIELYPNLVVDLELGDRYPDLENENIDVLCGAEYEVPDHLVCKKIASIQRVLCATPSYLDKFGIPNSPEDLRKHRYITHSCRVPDNLLLFKNDKHIYLDYFLRLNDAQAMLKCGLNGLGIIRIHNYYINEHIKNGSLIEILKQYREPPKSMYIFYQQQKYLQPKIRLFLDFLYRKINDNPISNLL